MEGREEKEGWSSREPVDALAPTDDDERTLVTVVGVDVAQGDVGQLKGKVLVTTGQVSTWRSYILLSNIESIKNVV